MQGNDHCANLDGVAMCSSILLYERLKFVEKIESFCPYVKFFAMDGGEKFRSSQKSVQVSAKSVKSYETSRKLRVSREM